MAPPTLKQLLAAASTLLGLSTPTPASLSRKPSLISILADRLDSLRSLTQSWPTPPPLPPALARLSERQLQDATASAALQLLRLIAECARTPAPPPPTDPAPSTSTARPTEQGQGAGAQAPVFGARDIKALGMLAGVVARWGVGTKVKDGVLPPSAGAAAKKQDEPRIREVTDSDLEYEATREQELARCVKGLVEVLGLGRAKGDAEKQLVRLVMPQVLLPLVAGLVQLAFLAQEGGGAWAREALEGLFTSNPATTILATLLTLLGSVRPPSSTVLRPVLSNLLSTQLLRPGGVRSLLIVIVGTGSAGGGADDDVNIKQLEMLKRLLGARAEGVDEKAYFSNIITQLLAILRTGAIASLAASSTSSSPPAQSSTSRGKAPAHRPTTPTTTPIQPAPPAPILRATSYVLAHFLVAPSSSIARGVVLEALHAPLVPFSYPSSKRTLLPPQALLEHLTLLSLLTLYAPPLPGFLSTLLSPVLPALFSLLAFLAHHDRPSLLRPSSSSADAGGGVKEEAEALLHVFGKGVTVDEGVEGTRTAVERWENGDEFGSAAGAGAGTGEEQEWVAEWTWVDRGPALALRDASEPAPEPEVELLKPASEDNDEEEHALAGVRVDAQVLVRWLKALERKELSGRLFLRWLDEVKVLKGVEGVEGARRSVVRLQLVLKMVEDLGSDIFTDPKEIIAFVAHALDAGSDLKSQPSPVQRSKEGESGLRMEDLRIVEEKMEGVEEERAEEHLEYGAAAGLGKDEMVLTALTLLLAVLEANPSLDTSNTRLLSVIHSQLDTVSASSTSPLVPPLAREAKLVLSLRRASSAFAPSSAPSSSSAKDDPLAASREKYQEALKLLQDPLLPVRAQGLHLLRMLVLDRERALLTTDPALLPAVLDIFVQAIEEEDSFLYLNAVQGLSSLVDVYGRRVVGRLMEVYLGGGGGGAGRMEVGDVGDGEKGRRELDKRLRVGETLVQVISRAGEALATLVDILIPPLLVVLRASSLPVPLRASAITILASAVETAPTAMLPHVDLLTDACVTLLSIESVAVTPRTTRAATPTSSSGKDKDKANNKAPAKNPVLIEEITSSSSEEEEESEPDEPAVDRAGRPEELPSPLTTSSKHPALRRAAVVFLGLLLRTAIRARYEAHEKAERARWEGGVEDLLGGKLRLPGQAEREVGVPGRGSRGRGRGREEEGSAAGLLLLNEEVKERMRTVLRYVGETDVDGLVRHQAGEVLEEMEEAGV
ncbi:hypothetical protein JCM5296_005389 [Sporobolomyces johnsonii]